MIFVHLLRRICSQRHNFVMDKVPRGFAIVVNIRRGHGQFEERLGSEIDVAMIGNVFTKLHFNVRKYCDPSAKVTH